jgi:hypothetical protein
VRRVERKEPPQWLREKDWNYPAAADDLHGWLDTLLECYKRVHDVDTTEWERPGETLMPAYIGPPAVQSLGQADLSTLPNLERPSILLQIWLRATDDVILEGVREELAKARKCHPSPVKKPGPQTLGAGITNKHTSRWCSRRIIELARLDHERRKNPDAFSKADMADWLFPTAAQPPKMLDDAYKTLSQALNQIPALWAQLNPGRALPPIQPN